MSEREKRILGRYQIWRSYLNKREENVGLDSSQRNSGYEDSAVCEAGGTCGSCTGCGGCNSCG